MDSKKLRHILVRHEQGAGHAAEGYCRGKWKSWSLYCYKRSGCYKPGNCNRRCSLDSVPMLAITGQVNSFAIGTDAFQEADIVGITMPITKHSFLVTRAEDIPGVVAAAYEIATTGRPGPVFD